MNCELTCDVSMELIKRCLEMNFDVCFEKQPHFGQFITEKRPANEETIFFRIFFFPRMHAFYLTKKKKDKITLHLDLYYGERISSIDVRNKIWEIIPCMKGSPPHIRSLLPPILDFTDDETEEDKKMEENWKQIQRQMFIEGLTNREEYCYGALECNLSMEPMKEQLLEKAPMIKILSEEKVRLLMIMVSRMKWTQEEKKVWKKFIPKSITYSKIEFFQFLRCLQ